MSHCGEEDCTIVLNDLLCFTWCNLELCPEEKLLICLQGFYSKGEAFDAFRTLLEAFPTNIKSRLQKFSREPNTFLAIIKVMKNVVQEDLPIFVCKDLNNVPSINFTREKLRSCSKQSFYEEQNNMKSQISEIHDVLNQLKDHCQTLVGKNFNFSYKKSANEVTFQNNDKFISKNGSMGQTESRKKIEEIPSVHLEEDMNNKYDEWRSNHKGNDSLRTVARTGGSIKRHSTNRKKVLISKKTRKNVPDEPYKNDSIFSKSKLINISNEEEPAIASGSSAGTPSNKENWHENNAQNKGHSSMIPEKVFDENVGYITIYKCAHCKFSTTNEATANLHRCFQRLSYPKNVEESEEQSAVPGYPCQVCNITFKLISDLKAHKETHNTTDHQCPLCLERFSLEEWLEHVRQCPGNGLTRREDHYCPKCDVFYADKRILLFHMAYHDVSKPFECLECKFRFYTQKAVADHFKSHIESEYKLKCPFCYIRADKKYRIQEHIRSHTGDFPYKCHLCDRSTATIGALKTHISTHDTRRDFKCEVCDKGFKSNKKLVSHKRIHTNEKPHKCPVCGKGFKLGIMMKHHHRIHLDIKAHLCPQCPFKAKSATVLKRHLDTHSNAKCFVCSECDFRAIHKRYLTHHMKRHHPIKPEPQDDLY